MRLQDLLAEVVSKRRAWKVAVHLSKPHPGLMPDDLIAELKFHR